MVARQAQSAILNEDTAPQAVDQGLYKQLAVSPQVVHTSTLDYIEE